MYFFSLLSCEFHIKFSAPDLRDLAKELVELMTVVWWSSVVAVVDGEGRGGDRSGGVRVCW